MVSALIRHLKIFLFFAVYLFFLPGFSLNINVSIDEKPFDFGLPFQLSPGLHIIVLNISGAYPLKINSYSVGVFPENLEVVMEELLGIPTSAVVDLPVLPSEHTFEFLIDIPKGLCGQYMLDIRLNFTENRHLGEKNYKAVFWIPCRNLRTFLLYLLLRALPRFLFRGFLHYLRG